MFIQSASWRSLSVSYHLNWRSALKVWMEVHFGFVLSMAETWNPWLFYEITHNKPPPAPTKLTHVGVPRCLLEQPPDYLSMCSASGLHRTCQEVRVILQTFPLALIRWQEWWMGGRLHWRQGMVVKWEGMAKKAVFLGHYVICNAQWSSRSRGVIMALLCMWIGGVSSLELARENSGYSINQERERFQTWKLQLYLYSISSKGFVTS